MSKEFDRILIARLRNRNLAESRFSELFEDQTNLEEVNDTTLKSDITIENLLYSLKNELKKKEDNIKKLNEVITIMNKHSENMNDEIITSNIEINILQDKLDSLTEEHNKLIKRWLQKVQNDADAMNEKIELNKPK